MSPLRYVLDCEGNPQPEPDLLKWATWFENIDNRVVASTYVGAVRVSTVFLGIDHNFGDDGPPILYETMTFPGGRYEARCATRAEALEQHARMVARVSEDSGYYDLNE